MSFRLAELFVDIRARDTAIKSQMDGVKKQVTGFGVAVGTAVGSLAATAISAATSSLSGFFAKGISGALELNDSVSAVGVVFGKSGSVITEAADQMAAQFGVVKGEFLGAASSFGQAFKGAGKSQQEAAELGVTMAKLGMDMKSFGSGVTNQEAFTALQAALRGEFDPLERFNVFLTAATIESKALSMGLIKTAKDMDEAAKKTATVALIMEKTKDQQGDLARTADQSSNQWSKFTGTMTNMAVELGTTLEPAINSILNVGNEMLGGLQAGFASIKPAVAAFGDTVKEYAQAIGVAWRNMGDIWEIVSLKAAEGFDNFLNYLAVIPENVGIVAKYIADNWYQIIYDGVSASITVFQNFSENLKRIVDAVYAYMRNPTGGFNVEFKPLLDGFAATVKEFPGLAKPALVSVENEINAITDRMAAREIKLVNAAKDKAAAVTKTGEAAAAAAKKGKEFSSETMGAADFASKLRESIYNGGKDDLQKKANLLAEGTAKNTAEIAKQGRTKQFATLG